MGQIIRLPVTAMSYPESSVDLETAECVLLIAIRWWGDAYRRGDNPMPRLHQGLEMAGTRDAAFSIDAMMAIIARTVRRPIAVHCPRCPRLSNDEKSLLHAASLAQAGDNHLAETALRTALLSAHGAEFALGPLQGLGELFAEARLFLRRRRQPFVDLTPQDTEGARSPPTDPKTVH
jgi:hypothetical protein